LRFAAKTGLVVDGSVASAELAVNAELVVDPEEEVFESEATGGRAAVVEAAVKVAVKGVVEAPENAREGALVPIFIHGNYAVERVI
jgi:predicted secreted protein